jgi:chorismate mutase/prephenate dehydratase
VTDVLFGVIFDLSRSAQHRMLAGESAIRSRIKGALENTQKQFPVRPVVACQGIEGAYSQLACERMFPSGSIMYFRTFDSVFSAVEQGLCQYGILPLENSTAGSVNRIYDLMMEHECFIIRSCRVKVDHCLLAKKGVRPGDIKEIFSHEQAIAQCQGFLENLKHVKVTPCANTAEAARMVSESERCDIAALSSPGCAGQSEQLYEVHMYFKKARDLPGSEQNEPHGGASKQAGLPVQGALEIQRAGYQSSQARKPPPGQQ